MKIHLFSDHLLRSTLEAWLVAFIILLAATAFSWSDGFSFAGTLLIIAWIGFGALTLIGGGLFAVLALADLAKDQPGA
ncbi:MAG: hypothetical protein KBA91_03095 [Candidatus Moranbacteria bacterium]|jgi:hypothetical protein|nr:hypothetical protein [Candidatus Moranbacteria bacterium]